MLYPRDSATPEAIALGTVRQISDGAIQTSGVTVKILPHGSTETTGSGTVGYTADGIVTYTPTVAETGYTSFILVARKNSCYPIEKSVFTVLINENGYVSVDPADVRSSLGLNSADMDTQFSEIKADTEAILLKTNLITSGAVYYTADRVNGSTITMYYQESTSVSIPVDEDTTSLTCRLVVENADGTDVLVIENASLTKTSTTVAATITTAVTGTLGQYKYAIRDVTSGNRLVQYGVLQVVSAANKDA